MTKRNRRGAPWLYLILALVVVLCLYLFGWPIARQVILHRGEESFEETDRSGKPPAGALTLPDEP